MQIIEQFTASKTGQDDLNEDKIIVTDDFIAVLDGVTSRAGFTLAGRSTGRFAADVVGDDIKTLPADIKAEDAVRRFTAILREKAEKAALSEGKSYDDLWSRPATALILYSRARAEIWRVADSGFIAGGIVNTKRFPQEEIWCKLRHAHIHALKEKGMSEEDIRTHDPTWDLLVPLLKEFRVFANTTGHYGFGVINGFEVPQKHVEVFEVKAGGDIVLASDGYPDIFGTLQETEDALMKAIAADPLMYRIKPQAKGVRLGHVSFDDRSYIRFRA